MKITHKFIALASCAIWGTIGLRLLSVGLIIFFKKMVDDYELTVTALLLLSWFFIHYKAQVSIGKMTHHAFQRMEATQGQKARLLSLLKEHAWVVLLLSLNIGMKLCNLPSLSRATVLTSVGLALLYGAYSFFGMRTYASIRN